MSRTYKELSKIASMMDKEPSNETLKDVRRAQNKWNQLYPNKNANSVLNNMPKPPLSNVAKRFQKIINSPSFRIISDIRKNSIKINKVLKSLKRLYPTYIRYYEYIGKAGWSYIPQIELMRVGIMKKRLNLSENDLNKIFVGVLKRNDWHLVNESFKTLIAHLDSGYADQVSKLRTLIMENRSFYTLSFYVLFPVLEHIWFYGKSEHTKKKLTLDEGKMDKNIKVDKKEYNKKKDIKFITSINRNLVMKYFYKHISFNKYTYGNVPFSRHSIIHGAYNPNNLKFSDFLKLLLICRNESVQTHKPLM